MEDLKYELTKGIFKLAYEYKTKGFVLSAGGRSHHYFDCKKITLHPRFSSIVGNLIYHTWMAVYGPNKTMRLHQNKSIEVGIGAIGGLTLGADPICYATMSYANLKGFYLPSLIIRKEPKKHGTSQWVEGVAKKGSNVLVVDDVVTTGTSTIKAIERLTADGFNVMGVCILLDREENNGMENVRKILPGRLVESLVTKTQVLAFA